MKLPRKIKSLDYFAPHNGDSNENNDDIFKKEKATTKDKFQ